MIYIWNTSKVVQDLALNRNSEKQKAQYLLIGIACNVIFSYLPLLPCSNFDSWLVVEAMIVLIINSIGVYKCYQNNGKESGIHFLESFVCLSVPLFIKITLLFWTALAIFFWLTGEYVSSLPDSTHALVETVYHLVIFFTVTISASVFYYRMSKHIAVVNKLRKKNNRERGIKL